MRHFFCFTAILDSIRYLPARRHHTYHSSWLADMLNIITIRYAWVWFLYKAAAAFAGSFILYSLWGYIAVMPGVYKNSTIAVISCFIARKGSNVFAVRYRHMA